MHDYDNGFYYSNGQRIDLTIRENEILNILLRNKGNYVTVEKIGFVIYGKYDCLINKNIGCAICRLKKKTHIKIQNKHSFGYKID